MSICAQGCAPAHSGGSKLNQWLPPLPPPGCSPPTPSSTAHKGLSFTRVRGGAPFSPSPTPCVFLSPSPSLLFLLSKRKLTHF